jgi:DNA-binding MarR family transcriptional regulator
MDTSRAHLRNSLRSIAVSLDRMEDRHGPAGLTRSQADALLLLQDGSGLTISALAVALGLDKSSASRIAEELVRRGWVEQGEDASDRRRRPLRLTPRGAAKASSLNAVVETRLDEALARASEADRARLVDAVVRFAALLKGE